MIDGSPPQRWATPPVVRMVLDQVQARTIYEAGEDTGCPRR